MVEESAVEEEFDIEGVSEMVSACLPEFSKIEKEAVAKWLIDIEKQLREKGKRRENKSAQNHDPLNCISLAALLPPETQSTRVHHLSETSDAGSDSSGEYLVEVSYCFEINLQV